MDTSLSQALKRIDKLITREAESLIDPEERAAEFQRRLERTRRLMDYLGDPQDAYDVIHIGGTSGKGSIAMLCESILLAMGSRTGTHTTPYLQTALEKVRLDGQLIAPEDAITLSDAVMDAVEQVRIDEKILGAPHYAEAWLGLTLTHFANQGCDVGVIEVGMGGRYDCTNIVTPCVSVVSTVHYDHTRVLGDTLEEIAYHKAGIIKAGVPVVVGETHPPTWQIIEREAVQRGARLIRLGRDFHYTPIEETDRGGRFSYHGLHMQLDDLHIGLLGAHQFTNAAVALAALETYAERRGLALSETAIREGLAGVRFAGRIEVVQRGPMVLLDGAHNEEKVGALIHALEEVFHYKRLILALGMLETKNAAPIIEALARLADVIITTAPRVKKKPALSPAVVAQIAGRTGACEVVADGDPNEALKRALSMAGPEDLVVVTGSLYLLGPVRSHWYRVEDIIAQRTMFPDSPSRLAGPLG